MGLVDWTNVNDNQSKGSKPGSSGPGGAFKDITLRLEVGKKYRLRPIHKPIEVWRYWVKGHDGKTKSAITADPEKCIIKQKYPNEVAKLRYAVNVIDRADNKLKVLEAPVSVFRAMKDWADETKQNPGGANGCDFSITPELPKDGDKKRTTYKTIPVNPTTLTSEEMEMIKANKHDLEKIFRPTDQSKIEEILFGKGSSENSSQQKVGASSQGSTTDEDGFGF